MTTKKNLVKQMLMSIATAGIMSFSFTACNDDLRELESTNPLVNQVVGTWYDEFNTNGVLGEDKNAIAYDKVVRVAYFEKDGTGNWFKYYISDSKPIKADAGHFECGFNYSVNNEGTVNIHNSDLSDSGDHARSWSLQNLDGKLVGEEDQNFFDMELANAEQQEYAKELFRAINGGFEGIGLNANDFEVTFNGKGSKAFTYENWRQHQSIFINDDGKNSIEVNGTSWLGFSPIPLPNTIGIGENANMPSSVWEDVWAAGSDWELAFNTCGNDQLKHGSYLGFYNKYKGIVRVFAYIDSEAETVASDHEWAIQMNDELAQHSTFGYGVPLDRSIKDKRAIGQNGSEMAQTTTPWSSSSAIKRGLQPTKGWWAFDIDLSVYRGANVKRISDYMGSNKNLMKLRCLGISKDSLNLTSDMRGQLDGTISLEKTSVSSSSGIFAGLEDVLGKANGIKELYDLGTKIMNPNPLEAIGTGIELAKKGCDLFGIDYGATTEGKDGYSGEISMGLTAEINTAGIMEGGSAVSGNASPSLTANAFLVNSKNCQTLGEGIWNIKNTPKVYVVNDLRVDWRRQDTDGSYNFENLAYPKICSPFDGAATINTTEKDFEADTKPFRGLLCIFDPSNIEVELNPNIFPEGTEYKVTAVCGVRKGMKFGSTDAYRTAQGLRNSQFEIGCDRYNSHISDRPLTEAAFDGLYGFGSKNIPSGYNTGAKFDEETYNGRKVGVFGRGNNEFLLEPMALVGGKDKDDWKYYMLPAYEVTVTVTVEHEGRTFVYSRTYLPEYITCRANELEKVYNNAMAADKTHFTAMYDSQVARIQSVREWIARTPISIASIMLANSYERITHKPFSWDSEEQCGYSLIDGNTSTYWYSRERSRNYDPQYNYCYDDNQSVVADYTVSWLDFQTFFNNTPKSFTITCGPHTGRIPKNIRILAANSYDSNPKRCNTKWEVIYSGRINDKLAPKNGATLTLDIQKPGSYKYFRIECYGNAIDYSLAEFKFNY